MILILAATAVLGALLIVRYRFRSLLPAMVIVVTVQAALAARAASDLGTWALDAAIACVILQVSYFASALALAFLSSRFAWPARRPPAAWQPQTRNPS